jgi:hypothetical protein
MLSQASAALFLILALGLSWPRFVIMFNESTGSMVAAHPISMIATAVSLSSVALAASHHCLLFGTSILLIGLLLGIALRFARTAAAVISAAISMVIHLHLESTFPS